jgi:hypothetical protein
MYYLTEFSACQEKSIVMGFPKSPIIKKFLLTDTENHRTLLYDNMIIVVCKEGNHDFKREGSGRY